MATPPSRSPHATARIVAAFNDAEAARRGASALLAAGIDASAIAIAGAGAAPTAAPVEREERFLGRLVLTVVAWSIVGAAVGVVMGVAFNLLEIGPSGLDGFVIQVATWAIFAHMIAGMWAGYGLLTKGESRQAAVRTHDGRAFVSVSCADDIELARADAALRTAAPRAIAQYGATGQRTADQGKRLNE